MAFLVGDIGGTKTLLALFIERDDSLVLEKKQKFKSSDFKCLEEIIQAFLPPGKEISAAAFGIAGPIKNGECHATNLPWVVKAQNLAALFHIKDVFLLNDLVANAYGLKELTPDSYSSLNRGKELSKGNKALISAGTGLGEAFLCFTGEDYVPFPSEGGHSDFSPRDDLEVELFMHLRKKFGHVSYERVLSGQGLVNLFYFLVDVKKEKPSSEVVIKMKTEEGARVISSFGLSKQCKVCEKALSWFTSLYGAECGNFALKTLALGGVYLGGGIAPKILDVLQSGPFMKAFQEKGRFSELLSQIPVHVILKEETALLGALYYISKKKVSITK